VNEESRRTTGEPRANRDPGTPDTRSSNAGDLAKADNDARRTLAAIVESSDDAIISKTLQGVVTSWNRGAERLFGYTAEEMIGQPVSRLAPPDRVDDMPKILDRLRRGERVEHFETQRIAKDGRVIQVSLTISPIVDDIGQVIGASKVARDITPRKRAEEALLASEERYRALVETQSEVVCRFQADGAIVFVNSAYARARDTTPGALAGRSFWDAISREDRSSFEEMLHRMTPDNPELRFESRFATREGLRWLLWTSRGLMFDSSHNVQEVQATGIDITDRKDMEEKLREADERKNDFLAVLGHELRNPLAPLVTGLELLQQSQGNRQLLENVHAMMERQVRHLLRLVDDLLDVSRISRGTVQLRRALVDLNAVLDAALELTEPLITERQHKLVVTRPEDRLLVHGDFDRLTQVLGNLLNNAAKYTQTGGSIQVSVGAESGEAMVRVRDNGPGFPTRSASRLFDMFSHMPEHRDYTGSGGLGIGLGLARQLIELHGGTIVANSEGFGHGSEFVVHLPLGPGAEDTASESPASPEVGESPRRVLVVDDNVDAAQTLGLVLEQRGHTVRCVHSGHSALAALESFDPEIVLLDIGLPDIDGHEVAQRIRATHGGRRMRVYALTGWGQESDRKRSLDAGFDEHLTKPVNAAQLLCLIAADARDAETAED
jgi:PAS domain S-box-containing protein